MRAFESIELVTMGHVVVGRLQHGSMNLIDGHLLTQLHNFVDDIEHNPDFNVVILKSGLPDYYIAHTDLEFMKNVIGLGHWTEKDNYFHDLIRKIKNSQKIYVGQVEGRARGGGCELLQAFDLVFADEKKAFFSQPEILFNMTPAGGATVNLKKKVGVHRALEMLLVGEDISATIAERYGLINRSLPSDEIDSFVERVCQKISRRPGHLLAMLKEVVRGNSSTDKESLASENFNFFQNIQIYDSMNLWSDFLVKGGQTPQGEIADLSDFVEMGES